MDVVQEIAFSAIFSDIPRTFVYDGLPSDRIVARWTRADCAVALVTTVRVGHSAVDTFRRTEIAEKGEFLVDRCVTGGDHVGGSQTIGYREFFRVVVTAKDLLEQRFGPSSARIKQDGVD